MASGRWSGSLLGVVFIGMILGAQGIMFELSPGNTKCVSETLQKNTLVVGGYHVSLANMAAGTDPKINARVTSPHGNTLHFGENKDEGEFGFTATEEGNYMTCFWMHTGPDATTASIDFDWKTGVAAKDWKSIAKKEKLEGLELELRRLEDVVESIREEMYYLRDREYEMRNVNETTNAKVAWFSILSLLLCIIASGWQLFYLQSYFVRKKLL